MKPGDLLGMLGTVWASKLVEKIDHSEISHVAMVLCLDPLPLIIESTPEGVRTIPLEIVCAEHPRVFLLKALTLTDAERVQLIKSVCKFSAMGYSYLRCGLVGLDELSGSTIFTQYLTKHLDPMCSFAMASAYKDIGRDFGQPQEATSPGHILNFARAHKNLYTVLQLKG